MKRENQLYEKVSSRSKKAHRRYWFGCMVVVLLSAGAARAELSEQLPGTPSIDLVIALDVSERQPVGAGHTFAADTSHVVAWTRVTGASGTTIEHVWRYGENEFIVPLDIGGPTWRTWSRKTIPAGWTGEWTVEIRDSDGNVLATETFSIEESE